MNTHVEVQNASDDPDAPDPESCRRWIGQTLARLRITDAELTLRIVDEAEACALNRQFRNKNKPSNVLSFPFENPQGVDVNLLGDIVICAPVVRCEASAQNKDLQAHWAHMMVHGVLHLCGFKHEDDITANEMEGLEIQIMSSFGFDHPYEPRVA